MQVFDFDKTIYKGDSSIDFYLYCVKKHPGLLRFLPLQIWHIIKYKFHQCSKEEMKETFFIFLKGLFDVDKDIDDFTDKNLYKIQEWYLNIQNSADVVISASPAFLLESFSQKSTHFSVIASKVDKLTGKFEGANCHGEEKVRRFREVYPEAEISTFYSDSDSDLPMARLAKQSYKIYKGTCKKW